MRERPVKISSGEAILEADLTLPGKGRGLVVFAHGSGSSRHSPRNRHVARVLQDAGLATLLMDLLTVEEEAIDIHTTHLRFDIGLLAKRLVGATDWLKENDLTRHLDIGYFGASTGAAAALVAAAERLGVVKAVVSRGGRPDLAFDSLPHGEGSDAFDSRRRRRARHRHEPGGDGKDEGGMQACHSARRHTSL